MKKIHAMDSKSKRTLLIVLIAIAIVAATIGITLAAGTGDSSTTAATPSTTVSSQDLANKAAAASGANTNVNGDGTVSKEETVYVKADATGNPQSVTVSDWLKNAGSRTQIADSSTLSGIKNLKGDETFTQNSDGSLVWSTAGKDIYYQGTSSQTSPVLVQITYKLNGQSMTAADMKGKSGSMEMDITYSNNSRQNGIITPFTAATAMNLANDNFTNVAIDHGAVLSDGNNNIVVGLAFPGLTEDLGLSGNSLGINIPETVKITADVTNFEMGPTITSVSTNVLNKAGLSDVGSFSDLDSSISKLTSATDELVAGSLSAKNGADQLASGTSSLASGVNTLQSGVIQYTNGVSSAATGANQLNSGAAALASGAVQLNSGTQQLASGAQTLGNGALTVGNGAKTLGDGAVTAGDSLGSLATGIKSYTDGTSQIAAGANQLAANNDTLNSGATSVNEGITKLSASMGSVQTGTAQLAAGLTQAKAGADQLVAGYEGTSSQTGAADGAKQLASGTTTAYQGIVAMDTEINNNIDQIQSGVKKATGQDLSYDQAKALLDQSESSIDSALASTTMTSDQKLAVITKAYPVVEGLSTYIGNWEVLENMKATLETADASGYNMIQKFYALQSGAAALNSGVNGTDNSDGTHTAGLYEGTKALDTALATMDTAVNQKSSETGSIGLKEAVDAVAAGSSQLSTGTTTLAKGIASYTAATSQFAVGANKLVANNDSMNSAIPLLQAGALKLQTGGNSLKSGGEQVSAGAQSFLTGVNTLSTGANSLASGAGTLASGTGTLSNGLNTLNGNSATLNSGVSSLASGSAQLNSGAGTLASGLGTLASGMSEYKTTGIDKIAALYNNDFKGFKDKLNAVKDASAAYNNFSGISSGMDGTVNFIIETGEIKN